MTRRAIFLAPIFLYFSLAKGDPKWGLARWASAGKPTCQYLAEPNDSEGLYKFVLDSFKTVIANRCGISINTNSVKDFILRLRRGSFAELRGASWTPALEIERAGNELASMVFGRASAEKIMTEKFKFQKTFSDFLMTAGAGDSAKATELIGSLRGKLDGAYRALAGSSASPADFQRQCSKFSSDLLTKLSELDRKTREERRSFAWIDRFTVFGFLGLVRDLAGCLRPLGPEDELGGRRLLGEFTNVLSRSEGEPILGPEEVEFVRSFLAGLKGNFPRFIETEGEVMARLIEFAVQRFDEYFPPDEGSPL